MSKTLGVFLLVVVASCERVGPSPDTGRPAHASAVAGGDVRLTPAETLDVYSSIPAPADLSPLEGVAEDCTATHFGDASAAVVKRRLPVVRAVSSPDGYLPVVFCGEPERVTQVEFRASMGRSNVVLPGTVGQLPFRLDAEDPELLRFHHLFVDSLNGELVVRLHYDDGQVWRQAVRRTQDDKSSR